MRHRVVKRIEDFLSIIGMNLCHLFDLSLRERCEREALEFQGVTYTFGEIDSRSNRLAQLFLDRGLNTGDRVCVYLGNSVEMIDIWLACLKVGIIFVPINIYYRDREIKHILWDAEPSVVITESLELQGVPIWRVNELSTESRRQENIRPPICLDGDTPAAILYTSGTTGAFKGAILTHKQLRCERVEPIGLLAHNPLRSLPSGVTAIPCPRAC